MVEVLDDLSLLPRGAHAISLHASREEAADHAVEFLRGTPEGQTAAYWVPDAALAQYYDDRLSDAAPAHLGCVHVLGHEQVELVDGRLRPVAEVRALIGQHPEGVTAAGETISQYWAPETMPEHLEYESWFDEQPREESRFLCPYDLREVPPEMAPGVLRDLGSHHSHVVLSRSDDPAVRLLQLFIFAGPQEVPPSLLPTLSWAIAEGLVRLEGPGQLMILTSSGEAAVRSWGLEASVTW
jgi:hypothetical protein